MELVDTHTHLDLPQFADDLDDIVAASRTAGVTRWINVGFEPARWQTTLALVRRIEGLHAMLGLHPGSVDQWSTNCLAELVETVHASRPVAIGEIGIDLHWRQDNLDTQISAFSAQLDLAAELELPAVIHMRSADNETLRALGGRHTLPHMHFHSFDGNPDLQSWVERNGATIGVGGLITRKDAGALRRWVAQFDRDRVVLETDAPYLKPRGIRGTRNQPAYLVNPANLLAELWEVDVETVAAITTRNAERLFKL